MWPTAREQRCWVHKTANILNKLPKSLHTKAKRALQEIWMAANKTALAMVFKLVEGAQKTWRRIDGHNQLPKLMLGVKFTDGIEVIGNSAAPQAAA